jgi:hypothetical protein
MTMRRRVDLYLTSLVFLLLVLGQAGAAAATAPTTIQVVIDDTKPANSFFTIPSHPTETAGERVRLVVENHGLQPHVLQSTDTRDAIYMRPGETKIIEFTVTRVPLRFTCRIGARTPQIELGSHNR